VNVPDSASLHLNTFTIDAWVNSTDNFTQDRAILTKSTLSILGNDFAYGFRVLSGGHAEGRITDASGVAASVVSASVLSNDQFYHIAFTYDGTALKLYVNGVLDGTSATSLTPVQNTNPVSIGAWQSVSAGTIQHWAGLIDEVELFNRALSAAEIQGIANAGSAGKCRALQLTAAASRKTHGAAGTFDISLPISGQSGVECRSGGASNDYTLVFTFSNGLLSGNATVTGGTGTVSGSPTFSGRDMIVNVTGVTNVQILTVTLSNVTDVFNQVAANSSVNVGVLIGDTTSNRAVNATDVAQTKGQVGQPVSMSNFREDVNANGTISATDVAQVKSEVGTSLPP